jgi:predicted metal-binding protein
MTIREELIKAIEETGFDEYKEIEIDDIVFSETVFSRCARNSCGNYGKNYACPPLSGTLETNIARIKAYKHSILVNKIISIKTRKEFNEGMQIIADVSKKLEEKVNSLGGKVAGPGCCTICKECAAITNEPCRFPDKIHLSLEGSGCDVVATSQRFGMKYNAGTQGIGFFFLVLYNDY